MVVWRQLRSDGHAPGQQRLRDQSEAAKAERKRTSASDPEIKDGTSPRKSFRMLTEAGFHLLDGGNI